MKVAVIGTGFGERVVAVVWRRLGCEVEVVSPRDEAGIARVCASDVDLVSVHSPPFLHRAHVLTALEHGRNVLCDKPFGRDAHEAETMRDAAVAAGVLHFLNFEFRRHPAWTQARGLLQQGAIGDLQHISWMFIGSGLREQTFRWLFDRDQAGGWIGAYGSHAVDAMRYFFGDEIASCGGLRRTETTSRLDRDGNRHPSTAEDAFSGWFVTRSGKTISMDTAFSTPVDLPHRIELLGDRGLIEIRDNIQVTLERPGEPAQQFAFEGSDWDAHEPGLMPWLTAVRDAVVSGQPVTPDFDDGLAVARVMDQMRANMVDLRPEAPVRAESGRAQRIDRLLAHGR